MDKGFLVVATESALKSNRTNRMLVLFAVAVLTTLGTAKLSILVAAPHEFLGTNAILPLPNWGVAMVAALLELIVAYLMVKFQDAPRKVGCWLLWLVMVISVYRLGIWLIAPGAACHCLGVIGILIGSGRQVEDLIAVVVLALLASIAVLLLFSRRPSFPATAATTLARSLILGLLFAVSRNLQAEPVEISGEIKSEYFDVRGQKINSGISKFQVLRSADAWQVMTTQPGSSPYSIASDGRTTFTLIMATDTNVQAVGDVGLVDSGNVLLATPAELIPWWFFIISRETIESISERPVPWTNPRSDPQAFFCEEQILWSDAPPYLLSEARFRFSGDRVHKALDSQFLDLSSEPVVSRSSAKWLAEGMNTDLEAGICSVTQWTNSTFGKFPLEFEVRCFGALVDYKRGQKKTLRIFYRGVVSGIKKAETVASQPPLRGSIWTRDYRFRDSTQKIEAIRYGPTNKWLSKSEVDQSAAVTIRSDPVAKRSGMVRLIVVGILVLLILLPAAYGFFLRCRKENIRSKNSGTISQT